MILFIKQFTDARATHNISCLYRNALVLFALMLLPTVAIPKKLMNTDVLYYYYESEIRSVLEVLTIYNPVESQCDDTPLITASNAFIDTVRLKDNKFQWMALSRNLLKRWNGPFQYGDTVLLKSGDAKIDGLWIVQDNMNKRFIDRGDLLFHRSVRKYGKWENVEIVKIKTVVI